MSIKSLLLFCAVGVGGGLIGLLFGWMFAWSFVYAYVSLFLIVSASFYAQRRRMWQLSTKDQLQGKPLDLKEANEQAHKRFLGLNKKNFLLGLEILCSPFRLLGYVVLIVGFFLLRKHELFDVYGFLAGLVVSNIAVLCVVVCFGYMIPKRNHSLDS